MKTATTNSCQRPVMRRLRWVPILIAVVAAPNAYADSVAPSWEVYAPVSMTLGMNLDGDHGHWSEETTLSTSAALHVSHDERPYAGGLFIDLQLANSASEPGTSIVGLYGLYGRDRWQSSVFVFDYRTPNGDSTLGYGAKLRYALPSGSKVSIANMGALTSPEHSNFNLSYERDLSARLSLKLSAGAKVRTLSKTSVGIEFGWEIR